MCSARDTRTLQMVSEWRDGVSPSVILERGIVRKLVSVPLWE